MRWRGRYIAVCSVVLILLVIHVVAMFLEQERYGGIFGRTLPVMDMAITFTLLWIAFWAGRQSDKADYFRAQNKSSVQLIQELSQVEQELREKEVRYRGLLEQMEDAVLIYSQDRIVYMNPAVERLLSGEPVFNKTSMEMLFLVHPEDRDRLTSCRINAMDQMHNKEVRLRKRDGDYIYASIQLYPVTYDGEPALQVIVRDNTELKHSEWELRSAQRELKDVLRHQQGVTFKFKKAEDRYIHTLWDGELAYEIGLPPEEAIGRSPEMLFGYEWAQEILPHYRKAWEEATVVVFETSLKHTPCLVTLRPIIRDGAVEEVVGYCTDITLRKRTEEELLRAKEILESFFSNTSDAIDVTDLNGRIIHINQAFEAMYGWTYEECFGRKILEVIPPNLHDNAILIHDSINSGSHVTGLETRRLRKNGEIFDVSVTISPVRNERGDTIAMAAISRDITEQKRVETALRKSEAKYRLIAENMTDVIGVLDETGVITYISPSCKTLFGQEPELMMNQSVLNWLHPEDLEVVAAALRDRLSADTGEIRELRFRHAEGHWVTLEASSRWVPGLENADSPNILVVARDITERKRAEEMLRKSEKLSVVGQLAAGVAHEIRNPLTSLKGFLQLLKKRSLENGFFFEVMLSELERINTIVSEFLVLSKPQTAKFERQNMVQIVTGVVSFLESQAILNNVQIATQIDTLHYVPVECDENQIKQVFINLLKNAVEAMPNGGMVHVTLEHPEPGRVLIRFADEGQGIPEERIPKLGEPFYTTKEKGTGLGLMVSFRIIEDHKGTIRVKSKVGAGTVFDVELPVGEVG